MYFTMISCRFKSYKQGMELDRLYGVAVFIKKILYPIYEINMFSISQVYSTEGTTKVCSQYYNTQHISTALNTRGSVGDNACSHTG